MTKKIQLFLLAIIVATIALRGQTFKYTDITPPNWQGISFNDICFRDSLNGFAITTKGVMLRTKNAGDTWEVQRENIVSACIYFKNKDTAFCMGSRVFMSTDGGETWVQTQTMSNSVYRISFVDEKIGFAMGLQEIRKTSDGGRTWKQVFNYSDPVSGIIQSYHFTNKNNGIAFGRLGRYFVTTNGGENWVPKSYVQAFDINAVYFFNTLHGIASTDGGQILESFDGGASWAERFKAADTDNFIELLHFGASKFKAYTSSAFWQSTDSGKTWTKTDITNSLFIKGVHFTDSLNGYLVNDKGLIFRTRDGGTTWQKKIWGTPQGFFNLWFTDSLTGYVNVYDGNIIKTTDGGRNWARQTVIDSVPTNLGPIIFTSKNKGFIGTGGYVVSTDDAGSTWHAQKSYNKTPMTKFFYFPDADTGYAGTDNQYGLLTKTFDGGKTWTGNDWYDIGIDYTITSASFPSGRVGYVTSGYNQLSRTLDAGNNWERLDFTNNIGPKVLHFFSNDTGIVCGISTGVILRTTDGAKTWKTVNTGKDTYYEYFPIDKQSGFVFLNSNPDSVYYTGNTGLTWAKIPKGKAWRYVYFINPNYGYCSMSEGVFKIEIIKSVPHPTLTATSDSLLVHITPTTGSSLKVSVVVDSLLGAGNTYQVLLSDPAGDFTSAQLIGQASGASGVTIACAIPAGTPPGTGYRLRVVSSAPVLSTTVATALSIVLVTPASITSVGTDMAQYTVTASAGTTCTVTVTATGSFATGNIFTALLSDAQGNFSPGSAIGTTTATGSTSITCTIPAGTASGTGYRLRVTSSNPASSAESAAFAITLSIPTPAIASVGTDMAQYTVTASASTTCTVTVTATGSFATGNVFTALLSDAQGNFSPGSAIGTTTATGSTSIAGTIAAGTASGTGYRLRVTSSNPASSAESAAFAITLSVPQPCTLSVASAGGNTLNVGATRGDTLRVTYAYSGDCPSLPTPTVVLSDAQGGFASPVALVVNDLGNGTLQVLVPAGMPPGTGYKLRLSGGGVEQVGTPFTITAYTAVDELSARPYTIATRGGCIVVRASWRVSVLVYDVLGNCLFSNTATYYAAIPVLGGMYIVVVNGQENKIVN